MTLLQRIENLQKTWRSLLPHIPVPPSEDVGRWCNYDDKVIEQSLLRTARKFSATKIDPHNFDVTSPYKYTTAVARSIAEQKGTTL